MYEPEHKSKFFLIIIIAIAAFLGWSVFVQYRPMLITVSCSEIAANSTNILGKRFNLEQDNYSYEKVKTQCLEETYSN